MVIRIVIGIEFWIKSDDKTVMNCQMLKQYRERLEELLNKAPNSNFNPKILRIMKIRFITIYVISQKLWKFYF